MLVIANADAGTAHQLEAALRLLDGEAVTTSSPEELDDVVRRERFLVVAGGDGSLHAVVAALSRNDLLAETTVALLPLGTGNDFARGAGIPLDPVEAAKLAAKGTARRIDLVVDDTGGVVVNNVHVGAGAEASRAAQPWKRRLGPLGYVVGAALAAVRPPTLRLRVVVDGDVVSDRPTLQVAVGNAPFVGGGTELTPRADPSDGKADVLVSYAVRPIARTAYVLRLRRGEHHQSGDVLYRRASEVTVEGEPFHASADGEIQGPLHRRTWRVLPGALRMVLPEDVTDGHREARNRP
jgi:YegS/Rv2252/BmrU family lipid kinase